MSTRAAIYARVSTEDQMEQGYGLSYQLDRCQEHAAQRGYTVVIAPITDDYTGKTAFRPGINALLDQIAAQRVDVVIVHRTDRLGRRAAVQELLEAEIEARGAQVEYVTTSFDRATPAGRAMRRVQGAFDQLDYENLVDRLKEHKREAVKRGSVIVSRPPYGYRVVKTKDAQGRTINQLEIIEEEARIVRMIFDWYTRGDDTGAPPCSIMHLVRHLTAMRVPTHHDALGLARKHGAGVWNTNSVHVILKSSTYIGRWTYGKTKNVPRPGSEQTRKAPMPSADHLTIAVPAIIDESTWQIAQQRLRTNLQNAQRNRKRFYLFSCMATCAQCGRRVIGCGYHNTLAYRCHNGAHIMVKCPMPIFREAELDAAVWSWIQGLVQNPSAITASLQERQALADEVNARLYDRIATIGTLIEETQAEQSRLLSLYTKGRLDEDRWYIEDQACQQRITDQEQQRALLQTQLQAVTYSPAYLDDVAASCARIRIGMEHFTPQEKRATYELLGVSLVFAVEDGMKVAYATCIFDAQRLLVGHASIAFTSS